MAGPLEGLTAGRGRYLRPTSLSGRGYGKYGIALQIGGLRDAERVPDELRGAYNRMMNRLEHELVVAAKSVVPGGPEGTLGRQIEGRRLSRGRIVVGAFHSDFAAALDRGFTSTPKKGKALRFVIEGEVVFSLRARISGKHFYPKWLAQAPPIIEAVYESSFYDIRHLSYG